MKFNTRYIFKIILHRYIDFYVHVAYKGKSAMLILQFVLFLLQPIYAKPKGTLVYSRI